ncbi:unnamed protein product, partial [Ixodes persulcatus]
MCGLEVLYKGELHKLVLVYAPNNTAQRKEFYPALRHYLETPCKTVLVADFNYVLRATECSLRLRSDGSRGELPKLLCDFDLQDVQDFGTGPCPEYIHCQGSFHARLN